MKIFSLVVLGCVAAGAQEVKVPDGQKLVLAVEARGAQIYACTKTDDGHKWVFIGPDAVLYAKGAGVGKHSAGPVWTLEDGGVVKGTVVKTVPSSRPAAVPWLLLEAQSNGVGMLSRVDYVTRTGTLGGTTQGEKCDAHEVGGKLRKDYVATYSFFAPK